jgi:hypothetical protein
VSHQSRINGEPTPVDTPAHAVDFMPGALLRVDVPLVSRLSVAATGRLNRMQTRWAKELGMPPRTLLGAALAPTLRIPVKTRFRQAFHFYVSVPFGVNWALTPEAPEFRAANTEVDTGFGPYWGLTLGLLASAFEHVGFGAQVGVTQHSVSQSFTTTNQANTLRQRDEVREQFSVLHFSLLIGGGL